MEHPQHPLVGRELKPADLSVGQYVWVQKEGVPALLTVKVHEILGPLVALYDDFTKISIDVIADGESFADTDHTAVALYEYAGKIHIEQIAHALSQSIALHIRRSRKAHLN
jgi:hypothetical protein